MFEDEVRPGAANIPQELPFIKIGIVVQIKQGVKIWLLYHPAISRSEGCIPVNRKFVRR